MERMSWSNGLGTVLFIENLPIKDEMKNILSKLADIPKFIEICGIEAADPVFFAAYGGEDYELLITCSPSNIDTIKNAIEQAGSTVSVIGEVTDKNAGVLLKFPDGRETPIPKSWRRFY